jgi:hypothetical protein
MKLNDCFNSEGAENENEQWLTRCIICFYFKWFYWEMFHVKKNCNSIIKNYPNPFF